MTTRRLTGPAAVALLLLGLAGAPAHADIVRGDGGDNTLRGTAGDDRIRGLGGDDTIRSRGGADEVWGGPGDDLIDSGTDDAAADDVDGGRGADRIFVRFDDDVAGGPGRDRIEAVFAGPGMEIDCGRGDDVVIYNQPSPQVETTGCERVRVVSAG